MRSASYSTFRAAALCILLPLAPFLLGSCGGADATEDRFTSEVVFHPSQERYAIQCNDITFKNDYTRLHLRVFDRGSNRGEKFAIFTEEKIDRSKVFLFLGDTGDTAKRLFDVRVGVNEERAMKNPLTYNTTDVVIILLFEPLDPKGIKSFRLKFLDFPELPIRLTSVAVKTSEGFSLFWFIVYALALIGVVWFLKSNPEWLKDIFKSKK
jgi:hypothetical protein